MEEVRCENCGEVLLEAEEKANIIIVRTCPQCKSQNKVKIENGVINEQDIINK